MSVTTTSQDVITGAYSHSKKNAAGRIITEASEGVAIVTRALRGLYAVAARINPEFFGTSADVTYSAGWARPQDAELVFAIENTAGDPISIVPRQERTLDTLIASVYMLGQVYLPTDNDASPTDADTLTFFYSKRPAAISALATTLDALWCEAYNELLFLEVAMYIAIKDGRLDEVAALRPERDKWAQLYIAFLEHEDGGQTRQFERQIVAPSLVSIGSLFAGGMTSAKG